LLGDWRRDTLPSEVANLLVYIERSGAALSSASLEALGEGRRVASFLGATLYALLPGDDRHGDPAAVEVLARHGADKVLVAGAVDSTLPTLHATHGHIVAAALARVPSALVVFAATPAGRDLAPRTAARLGAAFVPEPTFAYGESGELTLTRRVYGGDVERRLMAHDLERPLVVTLTASGSRHLSGAAFAEAIPLHADPRPSGVEEVARAPDTAAALETARVVVTAGAGVEATSWDLVRALAGALGGEVGVTRSAVEHGLGSDEREVGVGGRRVAPRLYVACAASGSPEHLLAVAAHAHIVAINRDPEAPIFRLASYGIVGDFAAVAPGLIAAARRKEALA
jgi:electron transfer flavoprotein alpha subunit